MTDNVQEPTVIATTTAIDTKSHMTPVKPRAKPRRKPARRRGGSDSEGDDRSVSHDSSSSASPAPVFADASSTTPAAWADMIDTPDRSAPVSGDEFSRGETSARGRGGSVRGRGGRGGKVGHERREFTEEEKKRHEEVKKAKKERQKAKRKEAKEAKRKEREATGTSAATPANATDASLAASTSALKLDDPSSATAAPASDSANKPTPPVDSRGSTPMRGGAFPRGRGAFNQRMNDAPRGGNFWATDNRPPQSVNGTEGNFPGFRGMNDFRGRGGFPRGLPPRGGFRGGPRGRGRGFAHLPFSPQAQAAAAAQAARAAAAANGSEGADVAKPPVEASKPNHALRQNAPDGKWGHDGFEALASEDAMRANHMLRGRGRGRGFMRGFMRGAIPHQVTHLPTPEASPDRANAKISEDTSTRPAAEVLLNDSGSVTVRLPGETVAVDAARPPSQAAEAAPLPSSSPFPAAFTPSNPSPGPYVASDSGSVSSGGHPIMPMHPNGTGEYYGGIPPNRQYGGGPFYPGGATFRPQAFTPEPNFQHQQRGSFSGPNAVPFYPNAGPSFTPPIRPRAGSPLNPYGQMGGAFVPRSAHPTAHATNDPKSPASEGAESGGRSSVDAQRVQEFVPGYYPYNPYTGLDNQGMYYSQQEYWPQTQYGQDVYGYGAEYQGY